MARRKAVPPRRGAKSGSSRGVHTLPRAIDASAGEHGVREKPDTEPQALVVSHWFDSGDEGEPYSATIRLTGRRIGVRGVPKRTDTLVHSETIDRIVPGSGSVSISSWVYGIQHGEWAVDAELIRSPSDARGASASQLRRRRPEPLSRAAWSWRRWKVSDAPSTPIRTRWALPAPLARIPAVMPGTFTALGVLGIIAALFVQSAVLTNEGVPVAGSLVASMLALVAGLIAAKLWSRVLHPGEKLVGPGWAVDGFLVVAPVVAVATALAFDLPIGLYLDATAPAIFTAVAIGRVGCFFTGCCAGRITRSRWGVWSSDRRVGARRVPTPLLESGVGLLIAVVTGTLVLSAAIPAPGAIFVIAIVGYLLVRQRLIRLRAEPRQFLWRRRISIAPERA